MKDREEEKYYKKRKEFFEKEYWGKEHENEYNISGHPALPYNTFMVFTKLIHRNGKIIDLGCGNGVLFAFYNKKFKLIPYGVDFLEKSIENAKKEIVPEFKDNFKVKNLIDYEFEDGKFDFIITNPHICLSV